MNKNIYISKEYSMNLETLIIIGLVLIVIGLMTTHNVNQSNYELNNQSNDVNINMNINTNTNKNVVGIDPDKSISTLFWGLFQNPNIFSDGWTFSEVSPNVYFKSTTLLNNRNHDPKF